MATRRCPTCQTHGPDAANFCAQCGTDLRATFVPLGEESPTEATPRIVTTALSRTLVPLGALAALALVGVLLFAGGGGDESAEADPDAAAEATPDASPSPRPTLSVEPPAAPDDGAPGLGIDPDDEDVPLPAAVDPATLPATTATHLAIGGHDRMWFLDLRTGRWVGQFLPVPMMQDQEGMTITTTQFGDGVMVMTESGGAMVIPVEGRPRILVAGNEGSLIAVRGDRALFQLFRRARDGGTVIDLASIITANGVETAIELPTSVWPVGLSPDGVYVVAGSNSLYELIGDEVRQITDGGFAGVAGDLVLSQECDARLQCATVAMDAVTGATIGDPLPSGGYAQSRPDGSFRLYGPDGQGPLYARLGDDLVELDPTTEPSAPSARDVTGIVVSLADRALEFAASDGTPLATVEVGTDTLPIRRIHNMALLTIEADPDA